MRLFTLTNKGKNVIRVFAESTEQAKDIAMKHGFAKDRSNLFIAADKAAPEEYHEGIASLKVPVSQFNLETLKFDKAEDDGSLGWYGGDKQQPKIGDKWWD
jgi:hypothetical protein